jgi:uncharacterized protein DUF2568
MRASNAPRGWRPTHPAFGLDEGQLSAKLQSANLAVKFALELAALGAFAYWGTTVGGGVGAVLLAIAAPLAAGTLWGRFAAPRARHRLPPRQRVPFELAVFALAAVAMLTASSAAAVVFTAAVIANALLLTVFGQWEG